MSSTPEGPKKQSDIWRHDYRSGRYMAHLSDRELDERWIAFVEAGLEITPQGKIAPFGTAQPPTERLSALTHLMEEFSLRERAAPRMSQAPALLVKDFDRLRAAKLMTGAHLQEPFLLRFGAPEHIGDALTRGRFRLRPASAFSDPSLGPARTDDEISVRLRPNVSGAILKVQDNATGKHRAVGRLRNLEFTHSAGTDYLVLCMAAAGKARLFADFDRACLVIRDPVSFRTRLEHASARIPFAHDLFSGPVKYYDPLRARPDEVRPIFHKHFRFEYQAEWRFAWMPHQPVPALDPVFIDIGPLTDIAEVLVL